MVRKTSRLIIPDVDNLLNACVPNTTYYCYGDTAKCRNCDASLLRTKTTRELCIPCKDLYDKKIIRRDCGAFRKNTKNQRIETLSDEAKKLADDSYDLFRLRSS
jgi:hypothetical protein